MKFLSLLKSISKDIKYYDQNFKVPYSKNNMTNPFMQRKTCTTMVLIKLNNSFTCFFVEEKHFFAINIQD